MNLQEHIIREKKRQEEDLKLYPEKCEGIYREHRWLMLRPTAKYGTPYWCGYVEVKKELTDEQHDILETKAHYGITGSKEGLIGFDCAHYGDFFTRPHKFNDYCYDILTTYKDYDYVFKRICDMIDYLVSL